MSIYASACLIYLVLLINSASSDMESLSKIEIRDDGEDTRRHCPCESKSLCKPVQRHVEREVQYRQILLLIIEAPNLPAPRLHP
jgi:hypothetical protein